MKPGWTEVALGEIALVFQDGPFGSNLKSSHYTADGVRVVRLQNIGVGSFVDEDRAFISHDHFAALARHECRPDDVLIATIGEPNVRACLQPPTIDPALNKADCLQLRVDPRQAVPKYVMHCLNGPAFQGAAGLLAHGQTRKRVSLGQLRGAAIPLPPIEEQRRIAAILDKADELRAKRRAALAHLDSLTQAIFLDMFGDPVSNPRQWPTATVGDVVPAINSGMSPICLSRPALDGEWGVLKLGAVTFGVFNEQENKALPPEAQPEVRHEVREDDVLFSRKNTSEHVAACVHVRETRQRLLLSDLIFRMRPAEIGRVSGRYLAGALQDQCMRRRVQTLATGSAASMPNISKAKLSSVVIPVPPTSAQVAFDRAIKRVEAVTRLVSSSVDELDALFASLQSRAFRGEL